MKPTLKEYLNAQNEELHALIEDYRYYSAITKMNETIEVINNWDKEITQS